MSTTIEINGTTVDAPEGATEMEKITYYDAFRDIGVADLRAYLEEVEDQRGACVIQGTDDAYSLISDMTAEQVAELLREEIERIEAGRQLGE